MSAERYGLTPWGAWFMEALARFDENGRLSRGRRYADAGRVEELKVEGGSALARVRGRSSPSYKVRIEFAPLAARDERELLDLLASDPLWAARIEAGELPAGLLEALKEAGIPLIPRGWTEMKRGCSCPDWGDPCKHMAAVYYLLAREIDRNPFTLFALRGVDLAARAGLEPERPIPAVLTPVETEKPPAPPPAEPVIGGIESYTGLIGALLAPKPAFAGPDWKTALIEFYNRSAAGCGRILEKTPGERERKLLHRLSEAELSCRLTNGFAPVVYRVRHPALDLSASKPGYDGLELARLLLAAGDPLGTPEYRYLFYLARAFRLIAAAGAFVPAVRLAGEKLRLVWRPLPAAADVNGLIEELARWAPALLRTDGRSAKHWDGRSTTRLLLIDLLSAYVRELGFIPSNASAREAPLVKLFFFGEALNVAGFSERSLPRALDAWLAAFSLARGDFEYSFKIERDEAGRPVYALSVDAGRDGRTAPLHAAPAVFGSSDPLRFPAVLAQFLPEIARLSKAASIELDESRLSAFLAEAAPVLRRIGAEVILPKELERLLKPRLVLTAGRKTAGLAGFLGAGALFDFSWSVALGEHTLGLEEFERMVEGAGGVVRFRDGWVRLDPGEAAALLERAGRRPPGLLEAVQARLAGETRFSADAEALFERLFREHDPPTPAGLAATLRPYQERGFRWIYSNLSNGFGCLLADDMGLGKTVQAIAVMLSLKNEGRLSGGALVVAPATLLVNWERELSRFAPGLSVRRYHRSGRRLDAPADLYLTTYETLTRDEAALAEREFSLVVLDEAHRIKNPAARQSKAVKALRSAGRLALSGTPVENNLAELHSIFAFALPGYLGRPAEFERRFRRPIELERNAEAAAALVAVTAPFLLRRLKTDPAVIADLPEKVSSDEFAALVPEQAALYESVLRGGLAQVEGAPGRAGRRANVLKLITSLKQVCNHPRAFDRKSPPKAALSGKCRLLVTLLAELDERREKALVFSQYVGTIEILRTIIREELGAEALLYHGKLSQAERSRTVDEFQASPARRIMLVSLKAGGVGLNLTAASRVIHYDLWFNPAVENQATDRAFRIGQTKDVFVHRLVTAGTFEEKIDAMLRSKRELADMSVATGEKWLAEMSTEELKGLFARH